MWETRAYLLKKVMLLDYQKKCEHIYSYSQCLYFVAHQNGKDFRLKDSRKTAQRTCTYATSCQQTPAPPFLFMPEPSDDDHLSDDMDSS